ncbi:MAG: hypothetical protein EOP19_00905 [Hyphomicrobiales bacterium]|nr:MAG: hypothetical protein EOP19_00905 [Hyphomicrobiales bacterium]
MTSKDTLPAGVLNAVRKRIADHAVIAAGKLPSQEELLAGAPFFGNRIDLDIQAWVDDVMSDAGLYLADEAARGIKPGTLAKAMKRLRTTCKAEAMLAVREAFHAIDDMNARRLDFYLACSNDEHARRRLIEVLEDHVGSWGSRDFRALFHAAVMLGLHDGARFAADEPQRRGFLRAELGS